MILATVLGAAAAVAGAPALGTAIITGGQTYAQNNLMRFSRGQEQAADQAGVGYLERVGHLVGGPGRVLPRPREPERPGGVAEAARICRPIR